MHIAVLEDETLQRELLELVLQQGHHTSKSFGSVAAFQSGVEKEAFDAALVDWMLPDGNGGDVLRWVRRTLGWDLPCIVITARDEEPLVVAALEAGADDYVLKPAKPLELLARIAAVSRRAHLDALPVLRAGDYEIDVGRQRFSFRGSVIELTQKEFDMAVCAFRQPDQLLSRDYLLDKVWGLSSDVDPRVVDTVVSRLRRKLHLDGTNGWRLTSVYGFGYRFERATTPACTLQADSHPPAEEQ